MTVLAAIAVPQALVMSQRSRTHAAARFLASRMARSHTEAVVRSATVALQFAQGQRGVTLGEFIDGNRNGVRTREIGSGTDSRLGAAVDVFDLFPGVTLSFTDDSGTSPIQAGSTTLISFTPYGTATSASVYLRGADGSQYAVRVLGATARTRVLRYDPRTREWIEVL